MCDTLVEETINTCPVCRAWCHTVTEIEPLKAPGAYIKVRVIGAHPRSWGPLTVFLRAVLLSCVSERHVNRAHVQHIDRLESLVAYSNGNRAVGALAFGRLSRAHQSTSEVLRLGVR